MRWLVSAEILYLSRYFFSIAESKEMVDGLPAPVTLEQMLSSTFIMKDLMENISSSTTENYRGVSQKT